MSKHNSKPPLVRNRSRQNKKQEKIEGDNLEKLQRKGSSAQSQQSHLIQLKEKGKKVLKKLIPNSQLKMIKKFMQKGAGNIKKQIKGDGKLLPTLTNNIIQQLIHQTQENKFSEVNHMITSNLMDIQINITENLQNSDMAQIVRVQTDKCYRHIPRNYFQDDFQGEFVNGLLTRDRRKAVVLREQLADYYDEVEFNVNQQVNYKLSIFMTFVTFLTSIGQLAELSINKIKKTRQKNSILKEIVIQKSQRVNYLRHRKEEIEMIIGVLEKVKKMKKLEDFFMNQVQTKGKISALSYYPQYCTLHQQVKTYCCPRTLCKFFDVAYYIQRGYHDSFCRSLKSYLTQIILIDQKQLQELAHPNKSTFASVTNGNIFSSLDDPNINLDESFEEDEIELVSKCNIEREIVSIYKQGLRKCSYSTDQICEEIKGSLAQCEVKFYRLVKGDSSVNYDKELTVSEKRHILEKVNTLRYVRLVQYWSDRMKKVVKRQYGTIERALRATKEIQEEQPQKYEVMCSYLMQILYITFGFIDQSLSFLITARKFKAQEADSIKQILLCQEQWKEIVYDLMMSYCIMQQFQAHFCEGEVEESAKEGCVVDGLIGGLRNSRRKMLEVMINGYSSHALENLQKNLKDDNWKTVAIPSKFYKILGEVIYGKIFTRDLQKAQMKLLSSSLLLDKNSSTLSISQYNEHDTPQKPKSHEEITSMYNISLAETIVKLNGKEYKLVYSAVLVVEGLLGFLEWVDQSSQTQKIEVVILKKIQEYLTAYNTQVKDLILNKNALNYGKITTKAITAKHLLTTYAQLQFIRAVAGAIAERYGRFQESAENLREKMNRHMVDINKKFIHILQLSIRQSINKMVVDPRQQIKWPVPATAQIIQALTRTRKLIQDSLLCDDEMMHFIGVQWCKQYLQKLKGQYKSVYKQIMNSNGTRKAKDIDWSDNIYWKYRELTYLVENLIDMREYMPGFELVCEELQGERKKLEHPH